MLKRLTSGGGNVVGATEEGAKAAAKRMGGKPLAEKAENFKENIGAGVSGAIRKIKSAGSDIGGTAAAFQGEGTGEGEARRQSAEQSAAMYSMMGSVVGGLISRPLETLRTLLHGGVGAVEKTKRLLNIKDGKGPAVSIGIKSTMMPA